MKRSSAHQAVAELERRALARLAGADMRRALLALERQRLIAGHALARQSMLDLSHWGSFQCQALMAHMTWVAAGASAIASAQRHETSNRARADRERMHWARCRIGLERRARRGVRQTWLD